MESSIVIKVKYGETLRRFNARVFNGELVLDMDGLKEKVLGLFNFASDGDLTLTYIDGDGDIVTLVDDEDLRDAMRQSLNPLRIAVRLNTEKTDRSYTRSNGSSTSTPRRSPRVQHPKPNLNASVSEILKSVPEPFREAVSKLSIGLASKATSTAPCLVELVDSLSKMGLSHLNPAYEFQTGTEYSTSSGASEKTMGELVSIGPKVSKVDESNSEVLPSAKAEMPISENNQLLPCTKSEQPTVENNKIDLENTARSVEATPTPASNAGTTVTPCTGSLNLNGGLSSLFGSASANPAPGTSSVSAGNDMTEVLCASSVGSKSKVKKLAEYHSSGNSDALAFVDGLPGATKAPASDKNEIKKTSEDHPKQKLVGVGASSGSYNFMKDSSGVGASSGSYNFMKDFSGDSPNADLWGGVSIKCGDGWGNSYASHVDPNPKDQRPFSGMPLAHDSVLPPCQRAPHLVRFKRSYNHSDGLGSTFHGGVGCDGCGVHPITGPRFKSKVKEDYDLCSICFAQMGNDADYTQIDRPLTYGHPLSFKGLYDYHHSRMRPTTLPQDLRGCVMKPSGAKLDSCFIQDVNVLDGTIMAPASSFTKIWRMRNNGTIVWPQGTQLVWIGGDRLSDALTVEIAADGLPVDNEVDIAVDFTAPQLPGRYISYWRMASPSGHKFGQRIWVLIQVEASFKDLVCGNFHGLNLNMPPESYGITGPETININVEPKAKDNLPEPSNFNSITEFVEPIDDAHPNKEQEPNFPVNDTLLVGGVSVPVPPQPSSLVSTSYPIIDSSEVPAVPSPAPSQRQSSSLASITYPIIDFPEAPAVPSPAPSQRQPSSLASITNPIFDFPEAPAVPSPAMAAHAYAKEAGESNDVEQTLLRELEEMGFRHVDLNKEILRANGYDMERSVDDLCGDAEWDPVLKELQEMGFGNEERNMRLLKKNNGSIKRVVMDLLNGEVV
ncbi:unnamed protein product [Ilex paraguariensis]|uniref:Protein NBR1 homolog n=1 Tax=Ilex paraguariensis TaxID=185542 RepID=A0ABC8QZ94_9AQUA